MPCGIQRATEPCRGLPRRGREQERAQGRPCGVESWGNHTARRGRFPAGIRYDGAHSNVRISSMKRAIAVVIALSAATAVTAHLRAQARPKPGEWTTYGGDLASTRYSPLDQINKDNFG